MDQLRRIMIILLMGIILNDECMCVWIHNLVAKESCAGVPYCFAQVYTHCMRSIICMYWYVLAVCACVCVKLIRLLQGGGTHCSDNNMGLVGSLYLLR